MSGGELVVLDGNGRDTKRFALSAGQATLGRDAQCDLRVLRSNVANHHATIAVHTNHVVLQNISEEGVTLVNGEPVSVAALQHGDVITIGDRHLRWQYQHPHKVRLAKLPGPAVVRVRSRAKRGARRVTTAAPAHLPPALRRALHHHRASMPGNVGGKQVAIVQPQRRDPSEPQNESGSQTRSPSRGRDTTQLASDTGLETERSLRKTAAKVSPASLPLHHTTKATLWIESRKSSPRRHARARLDTVPTRVVVSMRGSVGRRKSTPLRLTVLRRAQRASHSVTKISPPTTIDHTKQAAIMLMTGHAAKSSLSGGAARSPSLLVRRAASHARRASLPRHTRTITSPKDDRNDSVVEINDSEAYGSMADKSSASINNTMESPPLPTPMKSVLKDPSVRSTRKTESIKFDLSNLENVNDENEIVSIRESTQKNDEEENITLHYSDTSDQSPPKSPSPRRSIHSRSSRMLDQVGSPLSDPRDSVNSFTSNLESQSSRKSLRGSIIHKKALELSPNDTGTSSKTYTENSSDTTVESAYRTRNITSTATKKKLESYSIVDLVSADSNVTDGSVYDSVGSTRTSSITFGTPRSTIGRQTRSSISSNMLGSSTPKIPDIRHATRSKSSSILDASPDLSTVSLRRSKSLTTPENSQPHIFVNSTRVSRASRSRSRINDSDLHYISTQLDDDNDSPKSSRRASKTEKLQPSPNVSKEKSKLQVSFESTETNLESDVTLSPTQLKFDDSKKARKSLATTSLDLGTPEKSKRNSRTFESTETNLESDVTLSPTQLKFDDSKKARKSLATTSFDLGTPEKSKRNSRTSTSIYRSSLLNNEATLSPVISTSTLSHRSSKSEVTNVSKSILENNQSMSSENSVLPKRSSRYKASSDNSKNIQNDMSLSSAQMNSNDSNQCSISKKSLESPSLLNSENKRVSTRSSNILLSSCDSQHDITLSAEKSKSAPTKRSTNLRQTKNVLDNDSMSLQNSKLTTSRQSTKSLTTPETSHLTNSDSLSTHYSGVSMSSPNKSSTPRKSRNSSRSEPQLDGTITPEDRPSPKDEGTPVLNIQKLLDRSIEPEKRSRNGKRKTIGTLQTRSSKKRLGLSRSLSMISRKSSRLIKEDLSNSKKKTEDEDTVTPKSFTQVLQQSVKHKHSTAKKPLSKRSLIDNLDQSDIVKQLFNSPVKRKLYQSMTELSRQKLLDDDEVVPKKLSRTTLDVSSKTPDTSILDHSEQFSPECFVSPITPEEKSPNLSGVKRVFIKFGPKNDLSDLRGVKNLLKSPGARRSLRNDLSNVSGLKRVFAKEGENRLSDVRVKKLFTLEPRNDLRNVSGVKKLFQSKETNDLTDVRGVKKLFDRKSAANDLRNVSGVKKTMQAKSPQNDLTDVRGVRKLFRRAKPQKELEISGVKELFNESQSKDPEALFDELIGKPRIKAVYSKSFLRQKPKRKVGKSEMSQSLRIPIDVITNNVEDWIQEELQKRLKKRKNDSPQNSATTKDHAKLKVTRELQKLATDTVEGHSPVRASRVRDSTLKVGENAEAKKSLSDMYSPRSLPIKKRSLEAKMRSSGVDSAKKRAAGAPSGQAAPSRPAALLHSTPVKGRLAAMNVSELHRMSPIVSNYQTQTPDTMDNEGIIEIRPASKKSIERPTQDREVPMIIRTRRGTARNASAVTEQKKINSKAKVSKRVVANQNINSDPIDSPANLAETDVNDVITQKETDEDAIETKSDDKLKRTTRSVFNKEQTTRNKPERQQKSDALLEKATRTKAATAKPSIDNRMRSNKFSSEVSNVKRCKKSVIISKKSPALSPSISVMDQKCIMTRRQKIATTTTNIGKVVSPTQLGQLLGQLSNNRRGRANIVSEVNNKSEPMRTGRRNEKTAVGKDVDKVIPEIARKGKKNQNAEEDTVFQKEVAIEKSRPDSIKRTRKMEMARETEDLRTQVTQGAVETTKSEPVRRGRRNEKVEEQAVVSTELVEKPKPEPVKRGRRNAKLKEQTLDSSVLVEKPKLEPVRRGRRNEKLEEQTLVSTALVEKPEPVRRGRRNAKPEEQTIGNTKMSVKEPKPEPVRRGRRNAKLEEQTIVSTNVPVEKPKPQPVRRGRRNLNQEEQTFVNSVPVKKSKPEPVKRGRRNAKIEKELPLVNATSVETLDGTKPQNRGERTGKSREISPNKKVAIEGTTPDTVRNGRGNVSDNEIKVIKSINKMMDFDEPIVEPVRTGRRILRNEKVPETKTVNSEKISFDVVEGTLRMRKGRKNNTVEETVLPVSLRSNKKAASEETVDASVSTRGRVRNVAEVANLKSFRPTRNTRSKPADVLPVARIGPGARRWAGRVAESKLVTMGRGKRAGVARKSVTQVEEVAPSLAAVETQTMEPSAVRCLKAVQTATTKRTRGTEDGDNDMRIEKALRSAKRVTKHLKGYMSRAALQRSRAGDDTDESRHRRDSGCVLSDASRGHNAQAGADFLDGYMPDSGSSASELLLRTRTRRMAAKLNSDTKSEDTSGSMGSRKRKSTLTALSPAYKQTTKRSRKVAALGRNTRQAVAVGGNARLR